MHTTLDVKRPYKWNRFIEEQDRVLLTLQTQKRQPKVKSIVVMVVLSIVATVALVTLVVPSGALPGKSPSQQVQLAQSQQQRSFVSPEEFPYNAFDRYHHPPPQDLRSQPRPVIKNILTGEAFPDDDPLYPPKLPPADEATYPRPVSGHEHSKDLYNSTLSNITAILQSNASSCSKCMQALRVGQRLAHAKPKSGPAAMVDLCKQYQYASNKSGLSSDEACERTYAPSTLGAQYTQILSYANLSSSAMDAQAICSQAFTYCDLPPPTHLSEGYLDAWFSSVGGRKAPRAPKSKKTGPPLKDGRKRLRVLHLSDIHADPRFVVGAEANGTSGLGCRQDSFSSAKAQGPAPAGQQLPLSAINDPAHYWGNFLCDSPYALVLAAFQAIKPLNGGDAPDMTLFTGDMVTHDATWHVSQDLVLSVEQAMADLLRRYLGHKPVFVTLGNHDSSPSDAASSHNLPKGHEDFSWNYDYVSKLWESEGWLTHDEAKQVGKHYGGYSVSPRKGLRVISWNSDFLYHNNPWVNIDYANPDPSGTLRFITDELYKAEQRGEAVWLTAHVYTGWSGQDPLDNPTNLYQTIVERFQHTIRGAFHGHSHEQFFFVSYRNNATSTDPSQAIMASLVGPSITPLSRVNPSLVYYSVDPETYEVFDSETYNADLSTFEGLPEVGTGPAWQRLFSAREAYSNFTSYVADRPKEAAIYGMSSSSPTWPASSPLNATFWSLLTEEMERRPELMQLFTRYQGRNSTMQGPDCDSKECLEAKICYMRSGSAVLGKQCKQGWQSVQPGTGTTNSS